MLISLENVTFGYNGVPVVRDVSFALHENERVGFIGGNGEGKTTLIKLIMGLLFPDFGNIFIKNGIKIGYLEQTGGFDSDSTVYGEMESVFMRDRELISALRETELSLETADERDMAILSARMESLNKQIAARDSYEVDVRIRTVLNGMGFSANYDQKISTMSGGEKTRLKLCRLLLEAPDLLILDEPTNHLDVKTLFWLEEYLGGYKGSLFVVSHDRYFLDRLTERTVELERGKLVSYKGNYSKYKVLKEERTALLEREYEKQQEELAKLQDYVDRNLVRASTAKSAQSRVKQIEKMQPAERPLPPPKPPVFRFEYAEKPYERVIETDRFDLSAENKLLLKDASVTILRGQRIALTGDNGTGKTTLLRFLMSRDPRIRLGKFVKIAYYDQENADLDPEETVLNCFWGKYSLLTQTEARKLLAMSGLCAEDMEKKVKALSGGERAKLELALLQAKKGNILFLDEPTNHLDLPAREALEKALCEFDGTVLFVSHDRYFIQAIADRIALIESQTLSFYDGSYEQFLAEQRRSASAQNGKTGAEKQPQKQTTGYRSKEDRSADAKRKARIKEIETLLEQLEAEEAAISEEMAKYAADYEKVRLLCGRLEEIHAQSDRLYAEYETYL